MAVFTVTTLNDEVNDPGTGLSLREAIREANSNREDDTIAFDRSLSGGTLELSIDRDIDIESNITINGLGKNNLVIKNVSGNRIFDVGSLGTVPDTVEINDITLNNGSVSGGNNGGLICNEEDLTLNSVSLTNGNATGVGANGGAIFNASDGVTSLELNNVTLSGNSATNAGGGIYNLQTATLNNVTLNGNEAGEGGAIANDEGSALSVKESQLTNNSASAEGGAIKNDDNSQVSIKSSTLSDNTASDDGGAISNKNNSSLRVRDSTLSDNEAFMDGGALSNADAGDTIILKSAITGNEAGSEGGGFYNNGSSSTVVSSRSTLSGNSASTKGGAVYNRGSSAILGQSTITGNEAGSEGGGFFNTGSGTANLGNATVFSNSAASGAGNIDNAIGSELSLVNSIVAGGLGAPDIANNGTFNANGKNLVEDGSAGTQSQSSVINQSPQLGALQDNGGPTQTQVPNSSSPVVDAGDNTAVLSDEFDMDDDGNTSESAPFDQRGQGFPRILDGDSDGNDVVDLGAIEAGQQSPDQRPPEAQDDSFSTEAGTAISGKNALANDSDPDNNPLTVVQVDGNSANVGTATQGEVQGTGRAAGEFTIQANGQVAFDPTGDFSQLDSGESSTSRISYTISDGQSGTADSTANISVTVSGTVSGTASALLDVDGNGQANALSDGILVIRHLFEFSGAELTAGALGQEATRTEPAAIANHLDRAGQMLDIDANGETDALTDGILIARALFGFEGEALTQGALGEGAQRTQPSAIAERVAQLRPAQAASSSALSEDVSDRIPELTANRAGSKRAEPPEATSPGLAAEGLQPAQQSQLDDGLTASA